MAGRPCGPRRRSATSSIGGDRSRSSTWSESPDPFLYIWVYEVPPEKVADFIELYGSDGAWCELFSRADGYLGTEILEDRDEGGRFVTIDRWESRAAFDAFRVNFAAEFDVLDRKGEVLTGSETPIGEFGAAARHRPISTRGA